MPTFKIDLDQQTYEKLLTIAMRERRPTRWQAEVMLMRAVTQEEDKGKCPLQGSLVDSLEQGGQQGLDRALEEAATVG
jgi:hypothetical protein